jgi:hypothetical protein
LLRENFPGSTVFRANFRNTKAPSPIQALPGNVDADTNAPISLDPPFHVMIVVSYGSNSSRIPTIHKQTPTWTLIKTQKSLSIEDHKLSQAITSQTSLPNLVATICNIITHQPSPHSNPMHPSCICDHVTPTHQNPARANFSAASTASAVPEGLLRPTAFPKNARTLTRPEKDPR